MTCYGVKYKNFSDARYAPEQAFPAPSMTVILAQLRQRAYTSSVGRWRFYEREMAPLKALPEEDGLAVNSGHVVNSVRV